MVGDDGRRTIFQFPPNAVKFDKLTNRRGGGGGGGGGGGVGLTDRIPMFHSIL